VRSWVTLTDPATVEVYCRQSSPGSRPKSTSTFGLFKIRPDGTQRALIAELPFAPRFIDWGTHP